MNVVLALIVQARANSEGLIFTEKICCAKHMRAFDLIGSHQFPVGMTNEFCTWCAEEEQALIERVRQEDWYDQITPDQTVYISGPMSGKPNYNRERFWRMEHAVKIKGCRVLSPAHHNKEMTYSEYMKLSIEMVFNCTTVIMLQGYGDSKGAMAEQALASSLGKKILYSKTL